MRPNFARRWLTILVIFTSSLPVTRLSAFAAGQSSERAAVGPSFRIMLDEDIAQTPLDGRLYLFLSQRPGGEPRLGPNWFDPEPFVRLDVTDFAPGTSRVIDDRAASFPEPLSQLPAGEYRVQAILDHDFDEQHHAYGVGNVYSEVRTIQLDPAAVDKPATELVLNQRVEATPFPESDAVKLVELRSDLLSTFHQRPLTMRAAVVLPPSYAKSPERQYPVIYIIGGFGARLESMARRYLRGAPAAAEDEIEFIRVLLSGNCKWGHHVYADSATNGPRGKAVVEELIPHIDATFRTIAAPTARLLTGHSSGGWSSLWLQIQYPETFGGVWSTAPDPVDFRDYQQVNLYASPPESLYFDENGEKRPLARRGAAPVLWYRDFGQMDDVLGRGGQLRSFEAVFSPLDADGRPRQLWDRDDGRINPEVAEAWKKYDIRIQLEENWPRLEPLLEGKLHIYMGTLDTFYLNGAVERLAETLSELGSDAEVVIVEGATHSSLLSAELLSDIRQQMSQTVARHHPQVAGAAESNR